VKNEIEKESISWMKQLPQKYSFRSEGVASSKKVKNLVSD